MAPEERPDEPDERLTEPEDRLEEPEERLTEADERLEEEWLEPPLYEEEWEPDEDPPPLRDWAHNDAGMRARAVASAATEANLMTFFISLRICFGY